MNLRRSFLVAVLLSHLLVGFATAQTKPGGTGGTPAPATTTPAASSSSSSAIESDMFALGGMDHIAVAIAGKVCGMDAVAVGTTIVVYDQNSFASLQAYEAFVANSKVVSAGYRTLVPANILQSKLKAAAIEHRAEHGADPHLSELWQQNIVALDALSGIDPFSDATSLLSAIAIASNTENASTLSIPDSAMAMALTRELKRTGNCKTHDVTIIYPPLFGKSSTSDYSAADIQIEIQKLNDIRKAAHEYVAEQKKTELTNDLKDIDTLYTNFMNSLIQVNSQTGALGSSSVIQGYRLAVLLAGREKTETAPAKPPALVLLATIVAAGGTQHTHKNIWTALWSGDKITYSGGLAVEVGLWTAKSQSPLYADVLRFRVPFGKVKAPSDLTGVDSGDNLPPPPPTP
jgi:hypothetical protein